MSLCQTKLSWISFQRNRIVLYASKLAGCANMHKYMSQEELGQQLECYLGRNADYISQEEVAQQRTAQLSQKTRAAFEAFRDGKFSTEKEVTDALAEAKRKLVEAPTKAIEDVGRALAQSKTLLSKVQGREKEAALVAQALQGARPLDPADVEALAEPSKAVYLEALALGENMKEMKNGLEDQDPKLLAMLDRAGEAQQTDVDDLKAELVAPPEVVEALASTMYTSHGTQREDAIRETFQSSSGLKVETSAEFYVSKRPLFHVGDVPVFVGGRHDGIDEENRIVEIKTRQRRFLGTPLYEVVQVHAYMFMHDIKQATIVESFQGKEKSHAIEFDEQLWSNVCERTRTFLARHLSA
jgi:hypothetical protein